MSDDPRVEKALRDVADYLAADSRSKWREELQTSIRHIADQALQSDHAMQLGFTKVGGQITTLTERVAQLDDRVGELEDAREITGVENISALQRRLDSERAKAKGLNRVILGVVAALVVALLTTGTALAIRALTR